jgi:hypothetical protein
MQRPVRLRISRRRLNRVFVRLWIGDRRLTRLGRFRFGRYDRFFRHARQRMFPRHVPFSRANEAVLPDSLPRSRIGLRRAAQQVGSSVIDLRGAKESRLSVC